MGLLPVEYWLHRHHCREDHTIPIPQLCGCRTRIVLGQRRALERMKALVYRKGTVRSNQLDVMVRVSHV